MTTCPDENLPKQNAFLNSNSGYVYIVKLEYQYENNYDILLKPESMRIATKYYETLYPSLFLTYPDEHLSPCR